TMGRQVLTFFIVFAGLMLLFRGCQKPDAAPPALAGEVLIISDDKTGHVELTNEEHGVAVTLDRDGTIVAATDRDGWIFERVNAGRRPLHLNERLEGRTNAIPAEGWVTEQLDDGGFAFVNKRDEYVIRREVRLTEDGKGLDCTLEVTGAHEAVRGFQMTALSAVTLEAGAETAEPFALHQVAGEARASVRSWTTIVQSQETMRAEATARLKAEDENVSFDYKHRVALRADQTMERIGLLGAKRLVTLEKLPRVGAVNSIAYQLQRDVGPTPEMETWLDLSTADRGYKGTFRYRWTSRADAGQVVPQLAELAHGRSEQTIRLENDTLRLDLTDRGAAISSLMLKRYVQIAGQEFSEKNWIPMIRDAVRPGQRSLTMLLRDSDRFGINPADAAWEVAEKTKTSVTFRLAAASGWIFEKRISMPTEEDRYDLDVSIKVTKPESATDDTFKYVLVGPSGSYIADTKRGVAFTTGAQGFLLERSGGDNDEIEHREVEDGEDLAHDLGGDMAHLVEGVGVRGAFFSSVLGIPGLNADGASEIARAEIRSLRMERDVEYLDGETYRTGMQGRVNAQNRFADSERTIEARYTLYNGPNEIERLRPLGLEAAVDFSTFASIGRLLMWLMKSLYGLFGSFGIAIVFMTLIVRALLLPVSYKSQLSVQRYSKRMAKLKPLLEELEKKFGKNRQKLNQERMRI
ncbi:MAG: YidC/Oxa1 family insertase periplasmic-domain containing protein, partial [Planctomycetota bacterium]